MNGISMKAKSLVVLGALLMLAACSNDFTDDSQQQGSSTDVMAGYDGPLSVNISMSGSEITRAEAKWDDTYTDERIGRYPFPYTEFTQTDAVGIVHILKRDGGYQVFNYKAVTTDGGTTWSVQDTDGKATNLRYYGKCENLYYAYSPYVEGGLTDSDYLLSKIEAAAGAEVSAYDFLEPKVKATLNSYDDQSSKEAYTACDLLGAKGICSVVEATKTATLTVHLDHLMALDIIKLQKWNGEVTIYGSYDTWVAPDKTVWRMKQRLQPVVDKLSTGDIDPKTDGVMNTWYCYDADTCKFYMRLVEPGVEKKKFGYADLAVNGGWLLDIPAIPSGHFVLLDMPYYRFFRTTNFQPSEQNIAGETWRNEWNEYFKKSFPYTWTYEDILFADSDIRYDYDQVLEVGDQLLADGNISKTATGVGTVKWIAYAPQPWLATPDFYDGWESDQVYFYDIYVDDPDLFADNGYRPKGKVEETNGVKHVVVDYAGHGFSSADDFWATDICNHFLAFNNGEFNYSPENGIKHNDQIFSVALPAFIYDTQGLFTISAHQNYIYGSIPITWAFMADNWYLNKDGRSGIRSTFTANSIGGPDKVNGVSWKLPTVAEYFIGNYPNMTTEDYLTCNYLPGSGDNEGVVTVQEKYTFVQDASNKHVYFGNGYTRNYQRRINAEFKSYDCMPIARADDDPVKKDHLYIHNPDNLAASVIAPPTIYKACIAF